MLTYRLIAYSIDCNCKMLETKYMLKHERVVEDITTTEYCAAIKKELGTYL